MSKSTHGQPTDYADIKERSRDKLVKEFGPRMEINLHSDSQERLLKIAEWLYNEDFSNLDRGKTNIFRKTIGDIINMIYLDCLYTPTSEDSKKLYEIYETYDDLKFNSKLSQKEIKKRLSEESPIPQSIKNEVPGLKETSWKIKQIEFFQNYRWLVQTMEELDDKNRKKTKSTNKKK